MSVLREKIRERMRTESETFFDDGKNESFFKRNRAIFITLAIVGVGIGGYFIYNRFIKKDKKNDSKPEAPTVPSTPSTKQPSPPSPAAENDM